MRHRHFLRLALWITLFVIVAPTASAQFSTGSLVVLRVGDGTAALSNAGTAVFLDQFNTTGASQTANFTLAIPTLTGAGVTRLVNSGTATSEGQISLSADRSQIIVAGYDAAVGLASVASTTSAANPRVVNAVSATGTVTTLATTSTAFSGNNIRSATSDGTTTWAVGGNTGVVAVNSNTTVSGTSTNNRLVATFNGNLYFSTGSGTNRGIFQVGTGLPTAASTTSTAVSGTTTAANSGYAFSFSPSGTTLYVADDRTTATLNTGGIQKYTSTDGGATFSLAGTFTGGTGQSSGFRGVTADFSGANPIIYGITADTAGKLVAITDDVTLGAANFSQNEFVLATAPTNQAFRSVVFAPTPVPEPSTILGLSAAGMGLAGWIRRHRVK